MDEVSFLQRDLPGRSFLPFLRRWRVKRHQPLTALAEAAGISSTTLVELEAGRRRANAVTIGKLADVLEIEPARLIWFDPQAGQWVEWSPASDDHAP